MRRARDALQVGRQRVGQVADRLLLSNVIVALL